MPTSSTAKTSAKTSYQIRTVFRATEIIKLLGERGKLGIREIGRLLGEDKSNVQRTLATLEHANFVRKDPSSEKYILSPYLFDLGCQSLLHMELSSRMEPVLRHVHQKSGEIALLGVPAHVDVMFVHRIPSTYMNPTASSSTQTPFRPGHLAPIHLTAAGKAILAHYQPEERKKLCRQLDFGKATERSVGCQEDLEQELEEIRSIGYSRNRGEVRTNLLGVGVALLDRHGTPIGAISLAIPESRAYERRLQELGGMLARTVKVLNA